MARNDGIDRTSVRNLAVSDKAVGNTQQHNEREKDSYRNPDIIPQRTAFLCSLLLQLSRRHILLDSLFLHSFRQKLEYDS